MTPKQLKIMTTINLIKAFKSKARCSHCEWKTSMIEDELLKRVSKGKLYAIRLAWRHIKIGEDTSIGILDEECNKLIKEIQEGENNK